MMTLADLPNEIFASTPVVYAVGDEYQIFVLSSSKNVMWCRIDGKEYYDDSNGVLRSESPFHKIIVPAQELDAAGAYTIGYRRFQERVPYYNKYDLEGEVTFNFRKAASDSPKFYLISDVHKQLAAGVKAAKSFPEWECNTQTRHVGYHTAPLHAAPDQESASYPRRGRPLSNFPDEAARPFFLPPERIFSA